MKLLSPCIFVNINQLLETFGVSVLPLNLFYYTKLDISFSLFQNHVVLASKTREMGGVDFFFVISPFYT